MKPIRLFLRLLREAPFWQIAGLLLLMVVSSLTEGIGLLLLVPLLETLQGPDTKSPSVVRRALKFLDVFGAGQSLGGLLMVFLLLVLLRVAVQYWRELLGARLQYRLVDRLRERCFSALLHAEWRWLSAGRQSDHANLLLTDINRVGIGLNFGLSLLATLVTGVAYLLAACTLSLGITALAALSGGLVLFLLAGQRRAALAFGHNLGAANRALHGNVHESFSGIKLAKILGNERRHLDHFLHVMAGLRDQQVHFIASTAWSRALMQLGSAALLAAYLYVGLTFWHRPVAELLTLVLIFGRLIVIFSGGQQQLHHWLHALSALESTQRLLADCQAAAEPACVVPPQRWPVTAAIVLDRVTVRYAGRDAPALCDVSVRFPARTTTAVIGASGAGKSTLADVLMGLLAPDDGRLTVDDVPVAGAQRMHWRHSVAYVPQEIFLFHDTIRNNLLWAAATATEEDLLRALTLAAADFVLALPQGLDTVVGDRGIRLSGGERQRLALARALLTKPSLLILDEATSALDIENEARVRKAIENLQGNLTVVIIGHRLPTLEHADQVLRLDEGRLAGRGTWAEVAAGTGTGG